MATTEQPTPVHHNPSEPEPAATQCDPPRGRARPMPADERRAGIVAAVTPLLIEQGVAVTTRALAEAAGVSEGTIFKVFADKQELIDAVVESARDSTEFDAAVIALATDERDFAAVLIDAVALIQHRTLALWRLLSRLPHQRQRPPIIDSQSLITLFEQHRSQLRLEPVDSARALRGLALALSHPHLVDEPYPPQRIVDIFLNGATP